MNSMMNVGEVMNDRELVARILTNNLAKYGNILPDGFDFQATHGTEATSIVPMRRSNYLRYAAYLHEDSSRNPHFISKDDLSRLNCTLRKDVRPLYLESWSGTPETGFSARLVEYYNVDDVTGEAIELDLLRTVNNQSQSERINALRDFLSADPDFLPYIQYVDTDAKPADIIHNYVMHKLATQYSSQDEKDIQINTAVCQNLFHDFGIDYYNQENLLFFEHEIQGFKKHPRQLFDIFMEASKRYSKLEKEITRLQSVQQANSEPEKQEEKPAKELPENAPFKTLKVHLDFIDATITHPLTGEIITEGGFYNQNKSFTGEEAYLLLCAIIRKDKEIFNNSLVNDGDGKASFSLEYGEGDDKVILEKSRHDLGYLGYGNKCSVADSLTYVITRPYQFLLNSDEYRNSYYGKTLCNGLEDAEERVKYCHNKIEAAKHAFHSFQDEEKSYLASQKEVDSYNHFQAKLYTYICRKEDMDANMKSNSYMDSKGLKEIARDIIPAEKMKNYCVISVGHTFKKVCRSLATSDAADNEYENYTSLRNGLPPSMIAFTTACPPTSDLICHKPLLNVMYADDLEILKSIRDFSIRIDVVKKPVMADNIDDVNWYSQYGFERGVKITGYEAIKTLSNLCDKDEQIYSDALSTGIYWSGFNPTIKIDFDFGNNKISTGSYQWGTGELSRKATLGQYFFSKKDEVSNEVNKLRHSLFKIMHLTGDRFPKNFFSNEQINLEKVPDYDKSLKNYHEQYPAPEIPSGRPSKDYYHDCYQYYVNEALLNPQNNSKSKVIQNAILAMVHSGRNEAKIKNIANNLAKCDYYKDDVKEILKALKLPCVQSALLDLSEAKRRER